MMSRHLFYKAIKEDLRHKIWMIVLFTLISFLAVPMVWLLVRSETYVDWARTTGYNDMETRILIRDTLSFFGYYLLPMCGVIALVAGLVAGLSAFRYVFHKNRVDAYHSLPIKRSMLYGVCYVNGILVWFIPFLVCLLLTLIFAGGFFGRFGGMATVLRMLALTGKSLLMMLTVFFLVYHLVLVAVMLSGNILNTLVNIVLLGFGVVSIYGMWGCFLDYYMHTFYIRSLSSDAPIYASPLFSAMYLWFFASEMEGSAWNLGLMILINLLVAAFLGVCGWMLYQRRASEMAEQGVRNKVVKAVLRIGTSVLTGMGGWMIFLLITDNMGGVVGAAWKSFGAILFSVFVFGVLDVIFYMEFGAFFANKLQMAGTVLLTLVLCFAFHGDWFGYDVYLPEKDEIARIAVFDRQFSNRQGWYYRDATQEALENMQFDDVDAIYDFLKSAVNMEAGIGGDSENGASVYGSREYVDAKVTLKDGRSYYRSYTVPADQEILWPLFTSREYLEYAYLIHDKDMEGLRNINFYREGKSLSVENAGLVVDIIEAYHQDVLEHVEEVVSGEGQLMAVVRMGGNYDRNSNTTWSPCVLYVYSFMEHVAEVLKQAGYEEWVKPREISSIDAIRLELNTELNGTETAEGIIAKAVNLYGADAEENVDMGGEALTGTDRVSVFTSSEENKISPVVQITDRAEIEELFPYISYINDDNGSSLRRQYVRIVLVDPQGNTSEAYLQKGILSMKYIRRFADAVQENGGQGD